jgi:hypothetical protein
MAVQHELPIPLVVNCGSVRGLYDWLEKAVAKLNRARYRPAEWLEDAKWYWASRSPRPAPKEMEAESLILATNDCLEKLENYGYPPFPLPPSGYIEIVNCSAIWRPADLEKMTPPGPLSDLNKHLSNLLRYVAIIGDPRLGLLERDKALASLRTDMESGQTKPSGRVTGVGARAAERGRRRRSSPRKPTPLTPKQTEAMQLVGEHKGNIAAAARNAGKSRAAMGKLYKKATTKLGKKAVKHFTQRLPKDSRGQETVTDHE